MATRMQQRRGTAAQWTAANPILAAGEMGFETDTGKFKIGDGTNTWSLLKYFLNLEALDIDADGFITDDQKGANNGVASLDASGLIPVAQLPDAHLTSKINTRIAEVVGSAPGTLDTLQEIAAAFSNNPNYADSVTAAMALKAPLASPTFTGTATFADATFTGTVTVPTADASDTTQKPASTAFVQSKIAAVNAEISSLNIEIDGDIATLTTNVTAIAEDVVDLQTSVTSINTSISNVNSDIATLQANDISQDNGITGLDTRLDAAESTITGNSASIATINTTLSGHTTDIATLDTRIDSNDSSISTINSNITSIEGNIDLVEADVAGLQSDVSTLQSSMTTAQGNITTLQGDLTTANTDIDTIQTSLTSMTTDISAKVDKAGSTMTGALTLSGAPTSDLHASTKKYVDDTVSAHDSDTTNVHGITNTADLATKSYADNAKAEAISTSATAIALKADLASPALTGTPTAPTADAGTDTTQIATTAFVQDAIEAVVGAAPAALNTLSELADALADDANYASTITSALALKAPLASPTFTGTVALPAASSVTLNGTALSTTLALKADNAATINTMSGSHTIVSADVSNVREMSNGGTITIPSDTSWWPVGATIDVIQTGSSQVTIGAGSGVTLNATPGLKLRAQWSSATILKRAANTFVALGDLSA